MPNVVLIGGQWGDEGKGKIIDVLTEQADFVVRYQGGNNAGHTVKIGSEQFILHLIPSGILRNNKVCLIGNGVVVDPAALLAEIDQLHAKGIRVEGHLFISELAHLIFPYHRKLDLLREANKKGVKIGTTGRGIGPAYIDKVARIGIRIADLLDTKVFERKLKANLEEKNPIFEKIYGDKPMAFEEIFETYLGYAQRMRGYCADTGQILQEAVAKKKNILFEGAQGTLLDIDFGTYPYVTSSNASAGGACVGTGVGPKYIDRVIGVVKAYTTRVGEGPFPTELPTELGNTLREEGGEYGATTGRPRRCGWFDAVVCRHSVSVNGLEALAVTKMDVLDKQPVIKICTGYRHGKTVYTRFPANIDVLAACEPVYEELPGWQAVTRNAKSFDELPQNAKKYLRRIEELLGVPVEIISVGADRDDTIFTHATRHPMYQP